jgi:hypothetical protein
MGILDLVMTVALLTYTEAGEANPLMARFLDLGMPAFIIAKLASLLLPLCFIEYARSLRPAFVRKASIAGIAGYAVLLGVGIVHANSPEALQREVDIYIEARLEAARIAREHRNLRSAAMRGVQVIKQMPPNPNVDDES